MRKALIIALGLATLGIASSEPASARVWACTKDFLFPITCRWVPDPPPKPTKPWQGSASGVNKTFSPSNGTHQK